MSKYKGFSQEELIDVYREMYLSRFLDERLLILLRQGKIFIHIGGPGHEAAELGAAMNFRPGHDWAYPYYRDQAFVLNWGMTPREVLLHAFGKADDPCSGGRQTPTVWGHRPLKIVSRSACTGVQYLHATGTAMGAAKAGTDEVVYVSGGEGSTSEGEFSEALNWACRDKLPVVFHVEDNEYAISVHISEQTAGGSVYKITAGYENLNRKLIDGTDFFAVHHTFKQAVKRARTGQGPSLIVSKVIRLLPHSSSDDHRKYRTNEELDDIRSKDPLLRFQND